MTATLKTLVSFDGANGDNPQGELIADSDGDLLGATLGGGANDHGTVFEIKKTAGDYASIPTTIVSFGGDNGASPIGSLVADAGGDLFGTTQFGGANGDGTVFEIAKTAGGYASAPTTLVSFSGANGANPEDALLADSSGDLFGTTSSGGANNHGTVFEIAKTAGGYASTPNTLVSFDSAASPVARLVADSNGDLFGTTQFGGARFFGTVFEIKKTVAGYASAPTTLVAFNAVGDGSRPFAGLIADATGDLFGTTSGLAPNGLPFPPGAGGTAFEIKNTATGYASASTTLVSFNIADGENPEAGLIADANGDLFGTTADGGANNDGTVFEIKKTAAGYASSPTTLVSFNGSDGASPLAGLVADANGNLFGTTSGGGASNDGAVFEVTNSGFVPTASATPADDGILFWNVDGQAAIWGIDGTKVVAGGAVNPNPGPSWYTVGTGDFNDDGLPDILWQNDDGQAAVWEMNGTTKIGGGKVNLNPGANWYAIGAGDFNDDGHSDILWQNASTGQASIWEMNGNTRIGGGAVTPNPGPSWYAVGTGDFNDDGHSDILWQNDDGRAAIWEMNGNTRIGGGAVASNPGPSWYAVGAGDFNDDGHSDILWQNGSTGQVSIWEMNGNTRIGGGAVTPNPGANWYAVGIGDFNGDGYSDILWQNTSWQVAIWDMNGTNRIGGGTVSTNPGPGTYAIGLT